ncbi:MAG: hypothetical protein L0099_10115 [Acidobacteria bacterium]|nr:hypothetical protein [Acidobacteriota bacterium]
MRRLAVAIVVLAALGGSLSAADKKKPAFYLRAGQKAEIAGFAAVTAAQKCPNWAWAAGIETLLRALDVSIRQQYWVYKANAGEVCVPLGNWESLARLVPGEYQLDDGRKVRLEARYTEGASIPPDDLIAALRRGQSMMIAWRGNVYLLHGVVFDEYVSLTGVRRFEIKEMQLTNPIAAGEERVTSFVKGRDDPAEIQGTLEISATFIKPPDWLRKN